MLELLFNKVAGPQACNFIKKRLEHMCFQLKLAKLFMNSFSYTTSPVAAFVVVATKQRNFQCYNDNFWL